MIQRWPPGNENAVPKPSIGSHTVAASQWRAGAGTPQNRCRPPQTLRGFTCFQCTCVHHPMLLRPARCSWERTSPRPEREPGRHRVKCASLQGALCRHAGPHTLLLWPAARRTTLGTCMREQISHSVACCSPLLGWRDTTHTGTKRRSVLPHTGGGGAGSTTAVRARSPVRPAVMQQ